MNIFYIFIAGVVAYLLGSIPTAVWYGEAFYNTDVRKFGSGNAGATNTFRVLGKRAGSVVLAIDVLKGWTATVMASMLYYLDVIYPTEIMSFKLVFGLLAIIGHLFPLFESFRGGKGVATSLGMVLAIHPQVALMCVGLFLITIVLFHYSSLSSMLAALAFPVLLLLGASGKPESTLLIVFGFIMFLIVAVAHKKNIVKLYRGTENKVFLLGKKDAKKV